MCCKSRVLTLTFACGDLLSATPDLRTRRRTRLRPIHYLHHIFQSYCMGLVAVSAIGMTNSSTAVQQQSVTELKAHQPDQLSPSWQLPRAGVRFKRRNTLVTTIRTTVETRARTGNLLQALHIISPVYLVCGYDCLWSPYQTMADASLRVDAHDDCVHCTHREHTVCGVTKPDIWSKAYRC